MENLKIINYNSLQSKLDMIPLDCDKDVYCLYQEDFLGFLNNFLQGDLNTLELENIADLLESKDGVTFENELIKESIHKIANIDIQGLTMEDLIRDIVSNYDK